MCVMMDTNILYEVMEFRIVNLNVRDQFLITQHLSTEMIKV